MQRRIKGPHGAAGQNRHELKRQPHRTYVAGVVDGDSLALLWVVDAVTSGEDFDGHAAPAHAGCLLKFARSYSKQPPCFGQQNSFSFSFHMNGY